MARFTSEKDLVALRRSGQILSDALGAVVAATKPGVTTAALDEIARKYIIHAGGRPAFLGYQGYPASLCTSINDEVVHGIPSDRKVKTGDVIGLDLGVHFEGIYTDQAVTMAIGKVTPVVAKLIADTETALELGLAAVKHGAHVGDISSAIEKYLAPKKYGIIRQLTGHGVGRAVHEPPSIPNFGRAGTGPSLEAGMVLAIEPMVALGDWPVVTNSDGWTVVTADHSLAAHSEATVLVTSDGYELITPHVKHPSA